MGSTYEREYMRYKEAQGYSVHRVAGSGSNLLAVCDVILIKDGKTFFVECKKRKEKYYTSENRVQIEDMVKESLRAGAVPVLAVRLNGKKEWIEIDITTGLPQVVSNDKPIVLRTA